MVGSEEEFAWPCHFCGVSILLSRADFYEALPSGFSGCGECAKDWGPVFKNKRQKITKRLLRRVEEPPEKPPPTFSEEEIPLEHSVLTQGLAGVIAKANDWNPGNAIGNLLIGITYVG